ncbi:DUF6220 domain-containing protein [Paenibacillus sp. p3-SID867]|uniref:DUF6220 domain-containing protein n=1 Tax=Paenibacillus sp. p3-SID867 TaxID=2916363 RepID=UPI0021A4D0D9|nr:DUF6220 domain-containing protein [Paenibacillus sp. p3-SID867]MCT1401698.1 DUF6220 domain-containing protein [Paenibacillus sp. p3-SID867]
MTQQAVGKTPLVVWISLGLAWIFVVCIAIQTLFAGMALFHDGSMWRSHTLFVHFFEIVPVLMLIFGIAGKLPAPYKWKSLVLLLLVFSQYLTANLPGAGALHPVIAIGLFWLAVDTARGVLPSDRREQKG